MNLENIKTIYTNIGSSLDHRTQAQVDEDRHTLTHMLAHYHPSFRNEPLVTKLSEGTMRFIVSRDLSWLPLTCLHWPNPVVIHIDELPDDMGPMHYDSDSDNEIEIIKVVY